MFSEPTITAIQLTQSSDDANHMPSPVLRSRGCSALYVSPFQNRLRSGLCHPLQGNYPSDFLRRFKTHAVLRTEPYSPIASKAMSVFCTKIKQAEQAGALWQLSEAVDDIS